MNYTQDYIGGIEYRDNVREAIYTAEGRVFYTSPTAYRYEYSIKDHLGNARISFTDKDGDGYVEVFNSASNEVLQENHYYPLGLNHDGPWMNDAARDNKYQYNGKEWNDDFGLNLNDYGARWYDASVGRWWNVDARCEGTTPISTYTYTLNNPIFYVDLVGLSATSGMENDMFSTMGEKWLRENFEDKSNESTRYSSKKDKKGNLTITKTKEDKNTGKTLSSNSISGESAMVFAFLVIEGGWEKRSDGSEQPETAYGLWIIYASIYNRAKFGFGGAESMEDAMLAPGQYDVLKDDRYYNFDKLLTSIQDVRKEDGEGFLSYIWNMKGQDPNVVLSSVYGMTNPHLIMYFNHNGFDSAGKYGNDLPYDTNATYIERVQTSTNDAVLKNMARKSRYIREYKLQALAIKMARSGRP